MQADTERFLFTATLWIWRPDKPGTAAWHFVTVDAQTATEIRYAALGRTGGFGSVRVVARIGETVWQTSLFPHRESGGFLLPMKADVRKREGLVAGDELTVELTV